MKNRGKLVGLIKRAITVWKHGDASEHIADHLIANGVTFAKDTNVPTKWISVKDRLPDKNGQYLVRRKICVTVTFDVIGFAKDARKIDKHDFRKNWKDVWYYYDSEYGFLTSDNVTHWMPLPEPPEE